MEDKVTVYEPCQTLPTVQATPLSMIQLAIEKGAGIDQLERLWDMQLKYEANEAKKAYHFAMSEFKKERIVITKDKDNAQYKSKYTSIGNLVDSVTPILGKHGLTHKWDISQEGDMITVTCVSTHALGHSEKVSMHAPSDKSGAKNPIQQIKSTRTYLQAATFESLFGLASTDANCDDDGNGYGNVATIDEKQQSQIIDMMDAKNVNELQFLAWLKVKSVEDIPADKFGFVIKTLEGVKVNN
jgi:hypothetical protein